MKGLLLKDWYAIKSYFRAFFLMDIIFIVGSCFAYGNLFFLIYPCIFSGMISMSLIAYEEKEKWNIYAGTLPYSKAQLVSSKYVVSLFIGLLTILAMSSVQVGMMLYKHEFNLFTILNFITILLPVSLLPTAILLPFVYRFGAEKGRIIYYIVIAVFCGSVGFLGGIKDYNLSVSKNYNFDVIAFLAAVLIFGVSWLLSVKFYQNREI